MGKISERARGEANDDVEQPVIDESEYTPPPFHLFRQFVMDNGNKYVRASYPNAPVDLIDTIWCGVPVIHGDRARVMTARSEWSDYLG